MRTFLLIGFVGCGGGVFTAASPSIDAGEESANASDSSGDNVESGVRDSMADSLVLVDSAYVGDSSKDATEVADTWREETSTEETSTHDASNEQTCYLYCHVSADAGAPGGPGNYSCGSIWICGSVGTSCSDQGLYFGVVVSVCQ